MKRKLSLILASLLALSVLATACTKPADDIEQPEGVSGDEQTNVGATVPVELPEAVPTEADGKIVMKVNGEDVSLAKYRYYFLNFKYGVDGGDSSVWESDDGTLAAQLDSMILSETQNMAAIKVLANELGVTLSEEIKQANVDTIIAETIKAYEESGETTYAEQLENYFLTDVLFRDLQTTYALQNEVYGQSFLEGGALYPVTDELVLDYINDNYVRVKHILIKTTDLDDAEKAEARKRADNILDRAKNGESFEELVKEYSEDGMDPETGYYFTTGKMVQEFEEASYDLEVGEISDIVESVYGYHIIKKYEMEQDYILSDETLRSEAASQICYEAYADKLTSTAAGLSYEYLEGIEDVKAQLMEESHALYTELSAS